MFLLFFISSVFAGFSEVSFVANTNMPGVSVEGKSQKMVFAGSLENVKGATLKFDVFELETGMEARDKHLREKVFKAKNKGDAFISFEAKDLVCASNKCELMGVLTIKDKAREIKLPVEMSSNKKSLAGKATIALSQYDLPRPSFMGVQVEDNVEVTFKTME
ncbi:MAG: YceI family protein [Bacteriovoracaceae bacterium]|nr:YceI family protein [Bacteriovoracaceae bacterium]